VTSAKRSARDRLRRWVRIVLRGILHVLCLPLPPSAPRVLLWHSLDPSGSSISLRADLFAEQIAWIARQGYATWPASRYVEALIKRERLPKRLVVLTFDDGYANVLERGQPVLAAHGFCATIFLMTGAAGQTPRWAPSGRSVASEPILTWSQAHRAAAAGLEIESHTHSHPVLEKQPDERVREELTTSRFELASRGLGRGRIIAWPYGGYEARVGRLAGEAGYVAGFLDDFYWPLRRNPDLFRLNRITVNPDLGVFGVAFALGRGVELWSWLRRAAGTQRAKAGPWPA